MPLLRASQLEQLAIELLHHGGARQHEAVVVGRSLVDANLRGYDSHGVMRIPFYVEMIEKGEIVPGAELAVINQSPTRVVADANWGFGRVQMGALCDLVFDMSRAEGLAVGTLRHSSHIGRLGEYCELAAAEGLVSLMMVNTHGAARRVAPPGGIAPRLGTNPIAMGVPHGTQPLVLDFSTSATAEGKVRVKKISGQACPEGWLLDGQGHPTTDAATLYGDPPGTILPFGGPQAYKAFGLAMMIDVFAGALSGGLCAREVAETPKGNCVFFAAFRPEQFAGRDHFAREVEDFIKYVRECPRAEGVDRIILPGDPERESSLKKLADGIPIDRENFEQLVVLARRLGVRTDAFSEMKVDG